jgi:AbrB family looped-hinge helix DNA binding protein
LTVKSPVGILHCMTRVTGKFQITLPKRLVDAFGIRVGDEVELIAAGDGIRIVAAKKAGRRELSIEDRLQLFDESRQRAKARDAARNLPVTNERGWTREELYDRGRPR